MYLSDSVLGHATTTKIHDTILGVILEIGADRFTRRDLAAVSCFNFAAARNLSQRLNAELQVKNTREVYNTIAPIDLALPRLGAISLAVLGAAFEAKGIGGENPLESWMTRHADKDATRPIVTFDTLKGHTNRRPRATRDRKAANAERRAKRQAAPRAIAADADGQA